MGSETLNSCLLPCPGDRADPVAVRHSALRAPGGHGDTVAPAVGLPARKGASSVQSPPMFTSHRCFPSALYVSSSAALAFVHQHLLSSVQCSPAGCFAHLRTMVAETDRLKCVLSGPFVQQRVVPCGAQVAFVPDGLEATIFTADGDMRQALNNLQACCCVLSPTARCIARWVCASLPDSNRASPGAPALHLPSAV